MNERMISFDDFKKVEITVGKILAVEKMPETEKLLRLQVDFGVRQNPSSHQNEPLPLAKGEQENTTTPQVPSLEKEGRQNTPLNPPSQEGGRELGRDMRQIISGIAAYFPEPQAMVGRSACS